MQISKITTSFKGSFTMPVLEKTNENGQWAYYCHKTLTVENPKDIVKISNQTITVREGGKLKQYEYYPDELSRNGYDITAINTALLLAHLTDTGVQLPSEKFTTISQNKKTGGWG